MFAPVLILFIIFLLGCRLTDDEERQARMSLKPPVCESPRTF